MMSYRRFSAVVLSSIALAGCTPTKPIDPPKSNYSDMGPKEVPDFLKKTIWEQVDLANASPYRVAGFGLVVNLDGTGDTRAPNTVRKFMIHQMEKRGFGSSMSGMSTLTPEQVLADPDKRTAIVRVEGFIPPGAHKGQRFDVRVMALENSNTSSLHRGELYETDLGPRGDDQFIPESGIVNPMAVVKSGPIAINPAYALDNEKPSLNQQLSMKYGLVMNQGVVLDERPLILKLRQPERRLAKMIEARINERFQDANNERYGPDLTDDPSVQYKTTSGSKVAVAKDEGSVELYVPYKYGEDWERFIGVVMHLYFSSNADYGVLQARRWRTWRRKTAKRRRCWTSATAGKRSAKRPSRRSRRCTRAMSRRSPSRPPGRGRSSVTSRRRKRSPGSPGRRTTRSRSARSTCWARYPRRPACGGRCGIFWKATSCSSALPLTRRWSGCVTR
ncbi:MAG: flagellar basal body P-ring protein FlgI [Tepidisphaeraceae bacterium]